MLNLVFILLTLVSLGGLTTFYFWDKVNYKLLNNTVRFLVLSLPFERIPSLDTPLGNFRISQFLILFSLYLIFILLLKKDSKFLQTKLDITHLLALLFFIFSIPSWFFILDFNRFLVYIIATAFVFLGYTLISLFLENPVKVVKELVITMFFVGIFGFYQLIGDFLNIPYGLTGLKETYTKINFGIARVHTTAIEPLYYAGMLFLPIFISTLFVINKEPILELEKYPKLHALKSKIFQKFNLTEILTKLKLNWLNSSKNFNFFIFIVLVANFILTFSKGAWLSIALVLPFFVFALFKYFHLTDFLKRFSNFLYIISAIGFFSFFYIDKFNTILINFYTHIQGVIHLDAATSVQRLDFIVTALKLLPSNIVTGIGPGQYGNWYARVGGIHTIETFTNPITGIISTTPRISQIVNNVYLEIWLELGLLSFLTFLTFLLYIIYTGYKNIFKQSNLKLKENLFKSPFYQIYFAILLSLISYLIQWNFFSPVYIMPIFILLGVLHSFNLKTK